MMRRLCEALVVIALIVILNASAVASAWTAVGSTGAVHDNDKDIYDTTGAVMQINTSVASPANVIVRYNVVKVDGLDTGISMYVRYRDNGAGARVVARLRKVNLNTGGNTVLATLDSDDFEASNAFQTKGLLTCIANWNFDVNAYYVEVIGRRRHARNPRAPAGRGGHLPMSRAFLISTGGSRSPGIP